MIFLDQYKNGQYCYESYLEISTTKHVFPILIRSSIILHNAIYQSFWLSAQSILSFWPDCRRQQFTRQWWWIFLKYSNICTISILWAIVSFHLCKYIMYCMFVYVKDISINYIVSKIGVKSVTIQNQISW